MKIYPLVLEEQAAAGGANIRVEITHTDLTETTTNTAQTIPLLTVAAKMAVRLVKAVLVTPFKDASDAAFNTNAATVGDGNSAGRFLASTELNLNGSEVPLKLGPSTAAPAATAATVATADGSDAGTTQALANALKAELNKVITDLAAIRTALAGGNGYVYTGDDTVDLVVGSMSGKALADIDVGELQLFFQVIDHR